MNRAITLLPLALAACVPASRAPAPPPVPTPAPAPRMAAPMPVLPAPAPALGPDWRDWPLTPGTWSYRRDGQGSLALFGSVGADALLTLRCDLGLRRVFLSRSGTVATPLTLRASSSARVLPVQPTGGGAPYVAAALAPTDPLLDAMAFSRGRFTLEQAGAAPLVLPAWAEVGRVIEDCRG